MNKMILETMRNHFKLLASVVVSLSLFFFGINSIFAAWSPTDNISKNFTHYYTYPNTSIPKVKVDSNGTIHSVWCDYTYGASDMFYAQKTLGGSWSTPVNISNDAGNCARSTMEILSNNTVLVAWEDDSAGPPDIFYADKPNAGSWSTPVNVTSCSTCNTHFPSLVVDSNGVVYLSWYDAGAQ